MKQQLRVGSILIVIAKPHIFVELIEMKNISGYYEFIAKAYDAVGPVHHASMNLSVFPSALTQTLNITSQAGDLRIATEADVFEYQLRKLQVA